MSDLPKGWEVTDGGACFELLRGVSFEKSEARKTPFEGSVAVLRAGNLQDGKILFDDLVYVPAHRATEIQRIQAGDLIIAMSSGSKSVVGKVSIAVESRRDLSFGAFCALIRPRSIDIASWLKWFFQTREYRQAISQLSTGVNINNLKPAFLNSLSVRLPPQNEQRRIVAKLEACEARIGAARAALDEVPKLLEQYRQSVLAAAFRGDLTRDWRKAHPDVEPATELLKRLRTERRHRWEQAELAKYEQKGKAPPSEWQFRYEEPEPLSESPMTELPELPESWCYVSFDTVLSVSSGTQLRSSDMQPDGSIPVFGGNGIAGSHDQANVFRNTIVIGRVGYYCGSIHETPENAWVTDNALIVDFLPESIDRRFLFWLLTHSNLGSLSNSSAQPVVSGGKIYSKIVPIPSIGEQREIAVILDATHRLSKKLESTYSESSSDLTTLTQSLLAKAFRGELVPQDPNDEPASVLLERIRAELKP